MVELLGLRSSEIYGIGLVIVIGLVIWWIIRHFGSGRDALEKHEIEEDKELLKTDKEIRESAKDERHQADTLWNLINLLSSRLSQIGLKESGERREQYQFILQGLQVIRSEGKSVLQDKKVMAEINNAINLYLNELPNDAAVNELVKKIRDTQYKLFKDIIEQDELLRRKWALLRKEAAETAVEKGLRPAA